MPPRRSCANPLYLEWIRELRDKYDQDSNQYKTYNRAMKSLMDYPEYLATPAEARQVKFIGKTVEAHLVKRERELGRSGPNTSAAGLSRSNSGASSKAPRNNNSTSSVHATDFLDFQTNSPSVSSQWQSAAVNNFGASSSGTQALALGNHEAPMRADFRFCYIGHDSNDNEIQVDNYEKAFVNVELGTPGLLIEFPKNSDHTFHVQKMDTRANRPDCFVGYVPWSFADRYPQSTWFAKWKTASVVKRAASTTKVNLAAENAAFDKRRKSGGLDPTRQLPTTRTWNPSSSSQSHKASSSQATSSRDPAPALARAHTMPMPPPPVPQSALDESNGLMVRSESIPGPSRTKSSSRARPRLSSALSLLEVEIDVDIEDPYATTHRFDIPVGFREKVRVIPADHYEIVLILDNREKFHREDPDRIALELMNKGVRVERRALELGDVCWIAKRKEMFCDGSAYDEVTLDIILERKRLDDLLGSIKDGRFHEQKFRLHNSAITKVFYVVEEYKNGDSQDKNSFGLAIDTALSSTQVIDGFMVKETKSLNDTINYYRTLHRQLLHRHAGKPLHVFPSEHVKRYNFLKFQKKLRQREPDRSYLTTYDQFQNLNSKSGFMTVRETWARMLLCIKGVSPEKAGELVKMYPTPRSMYEAFLDAEERERTHKSVRKVFETRSMLENIGGNTGRRIGPALSGKIYDALMSSRTVDYD
ncbi:hypothetical protein K435DRAFT_845296 [Dendrothele bispora CBS 962.96]|uniref:Crossover junction endonuclease MUS81 n=1 Tax=Dendrothele bispora (strain CBS 962.96) TaxID=1314807 RepID=A0A4S8KVG6_DENBC|nr:hypothetical protein K435DRAFT_845296 [Dendrothele bispora CBS 962.96]